jgi:hypothetical protein
MYEITYWSGTRALTQRFTCKTAALAFAGSHVVLHYGPVA